MKIAAVAEIISEALYDLTYKVELAYTPPMTVEGKPVTPQNLKDIDAALNLMFLTTEVQEMKANALLTVDRINNEL